MSGNKIKIMDFDSTKYLKTEEDIAEYLQASLEMDDPEIFLSALSTAAKAKGMTQLAKDTGLGRESLYKTLSPGAKPRFDTILKIANALGLSFNLMPSSSAPDKHPASN
jgi:probable addiction module antidote protein